MVEFKQDHLHLRSVDPETAAKFYVDMFGALPVSRLESANSLRIVVDLGGLALFIERLPADSHRPPEPPFLGLEHIGLVVTAFEDAVAELQAKQAVFVVQPHSPRPGVKLAFIQAPDGVRVEILERTPG